MEEIDVVRALLSSLPRPTSLAERRERLDTVASAYGTASDIAFEPVRIGTCEAEWSLAPDSDPHRVLLYFHGGGYCSGSIRSHRGMVSEIGRAAKVRTLALGYRLAPEHPRLECESPGLPREYQRLARQSLRLIKKCPDFIHVARFPPPLDAR